MIGVDGAPTSPGKLLRWTGQLVGTARGYKNAGYAVNVLVRNIDGLIGGEIWVTRENRGGKFVWAAYADGYRIQWNPTVVAQAPAKLVGPG